MLRDKGIEARLMAPAGDPAITIEHIAAEGDFDAVVIGSRGLGTLARACRAAPPNTSRRTARRR